jgi:hypothetical protein
VPIHLGYVKKRLRHNEVAECARVGMRPGESGKARRRIS